MAPVGEPAADGRVAPHLASPLSRMATVAAAAPLHGRRDRLLPPLGAAAAVHT